MHIEWPHNIEGFPWLLAHKARHPRDLEQTQSEPSILDSNSKCVLVIDDETLIADSLTEILNGAGYEAIAFYNGRSAIDFVRTQCPDVVISDVVMPKLNGVETVLAIRKLCPTARIVLFSGQAGTVDILEKARAQGHEFEVLLKPIHPDELLLRLSGSDQI
jgi:CheY-like chemotaxis protein